MGGGVPETSAGHRLPPAAPDQSAGVAVGSRQATPFAAGLFAATCLVPIGQAMTSYGRYVLDFEPMTLAFLAGAVIAVVVLFLPSAVTRLTMIPLAMVIVLSAALNTLGALTLAGVVTVTLLLLLAVITDAIRLGTARCDLLTGLQWAGYTATAWLLVYLLATAAITVLYNWLYVLLAALIAVRARRTGRLELLGLGSLALAVTAAANLLGLGILIGESVLLLGVLALLLAAPAPAGMTSDLGQVGEGSLACAWADARTWLRQGWLELLAYGTASTTVVVIGALAVLLGVYYLLMFLLDQATTSGSGSAWNAVLFVGAVSLPQMAGLLAGGVGFLVDQAMAVGLLTRQDRQRHFLSALVGQPGTALALMALYFVGFLACAIPGMFVVVRWAFALLTSASSASEALGASWNLTRGPRGWTILGYQFLSGVASLAGMFAAWLVAVGVSRVWPAPWLAALIAASIWGFVLAVSAVMRASLFRQFERADHLVA